MTEPIYQQVSAEVKIAMKAREKDRVAALRLVMSEFKRVEIDERIEIDDKRALIILDKMVKQRKDSLKQFEDAGRDDLARIEALEIAIIGEFLPDQLGTDEVAQIVTRAIDQSAATGMQDMGKVMAIVKPQVQGRADMGEISSLVKSQLG
jgi:uncharacterized protein YqeY